MFFQRFLSFINIHIRTGKWNWHFGTFWVQIQMWTYSVVYAKLHEWIMCAGNFGTSKILTAVFINIYERFTELIPKAEVIKKPILIFMNTAVNLYVYWLWRDQIFSVGTNLNFFVEGYYRKCFVELTNISDYRNYI